MPLDPTKLISETIDGVKNQSSKGAKLENGPRATPTIHLLPFFLYGPTVKSREYITLFKGSLIKKIGIPSLSLMFTLPGLVYPKIKCNLQLPTFYVAEIRYSISVLQKQMPMEHIENFYFNKKSYGFRKH